MMTEDEAPELEAAEEVAKGLKSIGIQVLRNESHQLHSRGDGVHAAA